jgi:L-fuculose-phosphate aldolase
MTTEFELREQIVTASRRLAAKGLIGATEGNLSARLEDGSILVTPTRRDKSRVRPDEVILLDPDGQVVTPLEANPSSELALHLAVYAARPDAVAVIHAHPLMALAHAMAGRELLVQMPEAFFPMGWRVPVAPYAEPGTREAGDAVAPFLAGGADVVLMNGHGAVAIGPDPLTAADRLEVVERAAQLSLSIEILRRPLI